MTDKDQVREATDLVDLIGAELELRRKGKVYHALCPFHDDSRPSMTVDPERQTWRCWTCDAHGDAFDWIIRRRGVEFREALEMLGERAGIQIGAPDSDRSKLYKAIEFAAKQYHLFLKQADEAKPAWEYVLGRQITPESIERFRIGYAPNAWTFLVDRAKGYGISLDLLHRAGVLGKGDKGYFDLFRGRVIFPVRDHRRRIIALGGRILPEYAADTAKYYNSPATEIFDKGSSLYAIDVAMQSPNIQKGVVVFEGYTDVIMANQHGIGNSVAAMGTSLTERHIRKLSRHSAQIYLVFDGDDAGRRRANEILEMFIREQADVRIATLPDLDPCDFLLKFGVSEFREVMRGALDALDYKVRGATEGLNTHQAHQVIEEILRVVSNLDSDQPTLRIREQLVLARVAKTFGVEATALRDRANELRSKT